ncbi:Pycsar system effector family protein [Streptomyces sp. NPDC021622]|uniref:Pycsar system effector family protein n=1 Tax=Streptomyces sp. NPDC021622 TaxID=3155013 RepID=UPI0033EAC17F
MTGARAHAPLPPDAAPGARTAERLLDDLRTEIARADAKAAVLVAALGVMAGVFSGLLARREWTPASLSMPASSTWWAGVLALALTLLALLMTVLPRYGTSKWTPGAPLSYFGDIQRAARSGHLAEALADTELDPTADAIAALSTTSRIAQRKHQWVRTGLIAFTIAAVLLPVSLLIG